MSSERTSSDSFKKTNERSALLQIVLAACKNVADFPPPGRIKYCNGSSFSSKASIQFSNSSISLSEIINGSLDFPFANINLSTGVAASEPTVKRSN